MQSHYLHHVSGRVRVRTPMLKRSPARAERVRKLFAPAAGVRSVVVNVTTGSVTVFYDPDEIKGAQIIQILTTNGYLDLARTVSTDGYLEVAATRAGQVLARAAAGVLIDRFLGSTPLGVLAALV